MALQQREIDCQRQEPPSAPPQQGPNSSHPPQLASPLRLEQPHTAQKDIPFQDLEQQPPPHTGRDNPQRQRHNRARKPPQSPRRQTADELNPPSKGQRPSANKRHAESGSAVRDHPRHNNVRGPTDQRKPPPDAREVPARGGNSATSRSRHSQSHFRDGPDYNEVDSGRGNAGREQGENGGEKNPLPRENRPVI
ncbi:uncharacterized protein LOC133791698 [Humulus lupulus]|uniref:uncharacterized protein LOC133791698 n=1 Tax=Humulus lupulus TaxID=3486 RepID=UPI002B40238F|nr:uncharacterized protein LOC133791698 [Humulus lupulus]